MDINEYLDKAFADYPGEFDACSMKLKNLLWFFNRVNEISAYSNEPLFYIVKWEEGYLLLSYSDTLKPKT